MKVMRPGSKRPAIFNSGRRRKLARRPDLGVEAQELALKKASDQTQTNPVSSQVNNNR
jgi:hypothetical protein